MGDGPVFTYDRETGRIMWRDTALERHAAGGFAAMPVLESLKRNGMQVLARQLSRAIAQYDEDQLERAI